MLRTRWLGRLPYTEAWDLQRAIHEGRAVGRTTDDYLLLVEHPPVFTIGRNGDGSNLLVDRVGLGVEVHHVDRGGDITFHGPGQLVGYPILGLEDHYVETLCRKILGVWPANYNCPGQIVVSGENDAVEECCAEAESLGARRAIRLKVSGAFHSPLVARAADRLKPAVDKIRFADPVAPFMSTVTAKIEPAQRLAALLVNQLTEPVRFTQAAGELVKDGVTTFVEIGPGNVLSGLVKRIDRGVRTISVNDLASLEKAKEALASR